MAQLHERVSWLHYYKPNAKDKSCCMDPGSYWSHSRCRELGMISGQSLFSLPTELRSRREYRLILMYRRSHLRQIWQGSETLTAAADCVLCGRDVRTVFDCRASWEPHGSVSFLQRSFARSLSEHTCALGKSLCSVGVPLSKCISMYSYVCVSVYTYIYK
jgi:hypothetical protein